MHRSWIISCKVSTQSIMRFLSCLLLRRARRKEQGGNNTKMTLLQQMHVEASSRPADVVYPTQSHPSNSPPQRGLSKEFVLLKHPYTKATKVKLEVNMHQGYTTSTQAVSWWEKSSYQTCFKSRCWKIMFPSLRYFTGTTGWKRKVFIKHENKVL